MMDRYYVESTMLEDKFARRKPQKSSFLFGLRKNLLCSCPAGRLAGFLFIRAEATANCSADRHPDESLTKDVTFNVFQLILPTDKSAF